MLLYLVVCSVFSGVLYGEFGGDGGVLFGEGMVRFGIRVGWFCHWGGVGEFKREYAVTKSPASGDCLRFMP